MELKKKDEKNSVYVYLCPFGDYIENINTKLIFNQLNLNKKIKNSNFLKIKQYQNEYSKFL